MKTNHLKIIGLVLIFASLIAFNSGFDRKNGYNDSDYFPKHKYVGGDAYNFIINSNYFTGYLVVGTGLATTGGLFILSGFHIDNMERIQKESNINLVLSIEEFLKKKDTFENSNKEDDLLKF